MHNSWWFVLNAKIIWIKIEFSIPRAHMCRTCARIGTHVHTSFLTHSDTLSFHTFAQIFLSPSLSLSLRSLCVSYLISLTLYYSWLLGLFMANKDFFVAFCHQRLRCWSILIFLFFASCSCFRHFLFLFYPLLSTCFVYFESSFVFIAPRSHTKHLKIVTLCYIPVT